MSQTQTAALVLSGGGALGAAHIGALKVLERRGYCFDYIAGVSAGAIVGALAACGITAADIMDRLKAVNFFALAFDFKRTLYGLVGGDKVTGLLDEIFEGRTFADLPVPLLIGATDFQSGDRVMITRGRLADAVRASVSVPVIFEPFFHPEEKRWLVDGGLTQNLPLDTAMAEYRGGRIISVDVATRLEPDFDFAQKPGISRTKRLTAMAQRTVRIFLRNQQIHFPEDARVIKIIPKLEGFNAMDAFKLEEIAAAGERAAEEALA